MKYVKFTLLIPKCPHMIFAALVAILVFATTQQYSEAVSFLLLAIGCSTCSFASNSGWFVCWSARLSTPVFDPLWRLSSPTEYFGRSAVNACVIKVSSLSKRHYSVPPTSTASTMSWSYARLSDLECANRFWSFGCRPCWMAVYLLGCLGQPSPQEYFLMSPLLVTAQASFDPRHGTRVLSLSECGTWVTLRAKLL